jgi:CO/xanthine dehydrogenase FAD-binding subunit
VKPPRFRYEDADSVEEAIALLAEHREEAKVLAGGQSLVPMMSLRLAYPGVVVDVNRVSELDYVTRRDGGLAVGALTRQATLEHSEEVRQVCPLLSTAMHWVAHEAIRNRGTIGGSLAHADPAAELPAVATALGATVTAQSSNGSREIPIEELFAMPLVSTLREDELLTEVWLPGQPGGAGSAVEEIARRHGDFAIAGVATSVTLEAGGWDEVRLVAFAVGPTPIRLTAAEQALGDEPSTDTLGAAAAAATEEISPNDDIHASGSYRRRVIAVLVERALRAAIADAQARGKG